MRLPKRTEQLSVTDKRGVEEDNNNLGMPCTSAADIFVARISGYATRITNGSTENSLKLPK